MHLHHIAMEDSDSSKPSLKLLPRQLWHPDPFNPRDPLDIPFSVAGGSRGTAGQHTSQLFSLVSSFLLFYRFSGHSTLKTTGWEE